MRKRVVLFVIDSLQTGGAEKSLLDICSGLKKVRPIVCCIYSSNDLLANFKENGIEVHQLNLNKTYGFYNAINWLTLKVRELEPDLLVASLLRSELITRWVSKRTQIPLIGMIVSDPYSKNALNQLNFKVKLKVLLFMLINRLTTRYSTCFIANSNAIVENNKRALKIPSSRIRVIHRGRYSESFRINPKRFSSTNLKFLTVGRLVPAKNYSFLLKSLARFKELSDIKFELTVAGDGPLRNNLMDEAQMLDLTEVHFVGNTTDVAGLMHSHDLLLFTSIYEGFSGVIIESMFSGLPIICSDIPANLEAVKHRETALIYRTDSVEDFLENLQELLSQKTLRTNLMSNAREAAMQHFQWKGIVEKHESFYLQVMNNGF